MQPGCDKWMWVCNAQYQHCELLQLSEVALIVLYNVSDRWAIVGDAGPPGCVVFMGLVCSLKPSLLIRDLPVNLTAGTRWIVLFGAVHSAHTAGGQKTVMSVTPCPKLDSAQSKYLITFLIASPALSPLNIISHPILSSDTPYTL